MKNKINASEIQRKGLARVYDSIDEYATFLIENNRREENLYITKYKQNLGEVIQEIRKYKAELSQRGIEEVTIFGSLAHGDATSKSDVDIAFKTKDSKKYTLLNTIKDVEFLENMLSNISNLDIHHYNTVKQEIRDDIDSRGVNVF